MFVGLLFLSLARLQVVSAQNNNAGIIIQVNAGTDNILITEVEYEVLRLGDPYTYIQTSSDEILVGPDFQTALDGINKAGNPLPNNVAVNIIRIDFAGGSLVPTAQFPTTSNFNTQVGNPIVAPSEIQVVLPDQEIPHFVGDLLATNPVYFERIDDVISIPDMRSYWDLSGNALGDATEANPQNFMDVL